MYGSGIEIFGFVLLPLLEGYTVGLLVYALADISAHTAHAAGAAIGALLLFCPVLARALGGSGLGGPNMRRGVLIALLLQLQAVIPTVMIVFACGEEMGTAVQATVSFSAISRLYLGCISAVSRLYLGYISAISRLHLGYISAPASVETKYLSKPSRIWYISRLHLGYIPAISRHRHRSRRSIYPSRRGSGIYLGYISATSRHRHRSRRSICPSRAGSGTRPPRCWTPCGRRARRSK